MASIIKTYTQNVPPLRFIGKKYHDSDRVDGTFGVKWTEWHENNWFDAIKNQFDDSCIGLMRWKDGEPFEYWISYFTPENTPIPDGYQHTDFPQSTLGVCWVQGQDGDVFFQEHKCAEELMKNGHQVIPDENGACWFFERYDPVRFGTPDENGNVVLDICHYVK